MSNSICNAVLQAPSSLCFLHVSTKHPELKWAIMPVSRTSSFSSSIGFSSIPKKLLWVLRVEAAKKMPFLNRQARIQWSHCLASAGLFIGVVCCSSSEPVHADAPEAKQDKEASYSHGKKVFTDYSVTGNCSIMCGHSWRWKVLVSFCCPWSLFKSRKACSR